VVAHCDRAPHARLECLQPVHADTDQPVAEDYGLLGVAAVVETADEAEQIRAVLADAGIRATVAEAPDGRVRVLVFEADVPRARRVVGWPV
jgi:hypothetical protein